MNKRAALYARIPQAVKDVDKVANQVARLRAKAQEAGYSVVHVLEDDDISAYKSEKVRPGFLALLGAIKAGEVDVVVATEPDRLVRGSATELDTLSLLCAQAGAVIHYLSMGVQDPSSPHTRLILGILDLVRGAKVAIKNTTSVSPQRG
jgi:site-specific DNA recombinase